MMSLTSEQGQQLPLTEIEDTAMFEKRKLAAEMLTKLSS
jgi:hypothetical protein